MKRITKEIFSILKESDEVKEYSDELMRYIYDETTYDANRNGSISNINFPEYDYFNDYIMSVDKKNFDEAVEKIKNALNNIKLYNDSDGSGVYLELSDNHTMYDLNDNGKSEEEWYSIVKSKEVEFENETDVPLKFLGRSGRHVCVDLNLENIINYDKLKEVQERLEDEAVAEFNSINESTQNKFVPKQMDDYIKSYEKKYNKPVKSAEWLGCAGNDSCGEDYVKVNGKRYVFDIETKKIKESTITEGTSSKRIAKYNEFDNGKVIHSWSDMSDEEAEEQARQASLKDDKDVYYVQYDNVMNPTSKYVWYKGERHDSSEANNIIKSMNESDDINDALADDIKKVADIEPGSDEEAALNDMSTPRYGITYNCIYRSGDLMARQFQIQSDESFSLLLKLNDEERGTWIDVNRVEPDDWSWDFNQYIFDNNNSIDEEAKKMQELISTNYAEDVLQIIYEFARDYKLDKDDLEESDNSYWSSVPNEELMRIVSNLLSEYKGSKISKMINRVEGKINLLDLANKLEVDWETLLRTLEYMCSKGLAKEIDDSTYLILDNMEEYEELDEAEEIERKRNKGLEKTIKRIKSKIESIDKENESCTDEEKSKKLIDKRDDLVKRLEQLENIYKINESSKNTKKYELIEATDDDLVNLEKGSAFTFEGLMSDDKNLNDLVDFFNEKTNIKIPMKIYHATGEKVNTLYGLTGRNAYPNDLDIVLLPLDNWNELGDLPMIKTQIGARWFDDIVDNNRMRQEKNN